MFPRRSTVSSRRQSHAHPRTTIRGLARMFILAATGMAAGAAGLAGCVGATAHPPLGTRETAFNNPNAPSTHDVAATALRWVVRRYPPTGGDGRVEGWDTLDTPAAGQTYRAADGTTQTSEARFIINLPVGTRHGVYDRVIRSVGLGAAAPTPDNVAEDGSWSTMPIYHVSRVWVRGDEAKVDILRPIVGASGDLGQPIYQPITLQLRGGLRPWTVIATGAWSMGSVDAPVIYYLPEPDPEVWP